MSFLLINKQRKHRIDRRQIKDFISRLLSHLDMDERSECEPGRSVSATARNLKRRAQPVTGDREFSVVFIDDEAIRRYNHNYRGYDKPTDVLSFRGDDGYLGDILISSETAYNQARNSGKLDFQKNIRRLILHGLLHLMGYDHETDDGEMRAIERRLRRRFQC